jgi:hypothetical protein
MMLSGTWLRTNRFGGAAAGFAGATSEEVVASFGRSIVVGCDAESDSIFSVPTPRSSVSP